MRVNRYSLELEDFILLKEFKTYLDRTPSIGDPAPSVREFGRDVLNKMTLLAYNTSVFVLADHVARSLKEIISR